MHSSFMKSMSHLHVNVCEPFSDYCLDIVNVPDNQELIKLGAYDITIYVL